VPRYFFHVEDVASDTDATGLELPDLEAAKAMALRTSGEMLRDSDASFWNLEKPWRMRVTNAEGGLFFALSFHVEAATAGSSLDGTCRTAGAVR
jgi:hypothetical protein